MRKALAIVILALWIGLTGASVASAYQCWTNCWQDTNGGFHCWESCY